MNSKWRHVRIIRTKRKDISKRARRVQGATLRHAHKFVVSRWDNIREVRNHILVWMVSVATLIVIVGLQMLWFQQSYQATAPVRGGTYTEAVKGPLATLNPLYATSSAEESASHLIFSSLYTHDVTGHLRGDVARSMQIDPTGKVYTIGLKPYVFWHDGKRLTAKDVAFTVKLMKNPAARSALNASWKDIDVAVVNDLTVRFTLPASYAAFPQALTFSVLPEHVLRDVDPGALRENNFSNAPIGSGPFQVRLLQTVNETDGRKIVHLGSFAQYHGGVPKLERFQLHVFGTMDEIAKALRTGEVSAAADVSSDVAQALETPRYDVLVKPVSSGVYAIINTTQPVMKQIEVRRALQRVTDTAAMSKQIYGNPHKLALPFVSGQLTGSDVPVAPAASVDEANAILDAAGWKLSTNWIRAKDGVPLKIRVVTRKNSEFERVLEIIAGQWRKIGIEVEKQVVDPTATNQSFAQTVLQPRDYDVLIDELLIGGDPDVFAYWHSRGLLNFSNYSSSASDDALLSARSRTEPELRNVKYKAFARQWLQDIPAIGLYQSSTIYVKSKQTRSLDDSQKIISADEHYGDVQYWTAEVGSVYTTP